MVADGASTRQAQDNGGESIDPSVARYLSETARELHASVR